MQKQFITPKRFWYVGVIALTLLLTGASCPGPISLIENDTTGIKDEPIKTTKTQEWESEKNGRKICLKQKEDKCYKPVNCKDGTDRIGKPPGEFLGLNPNKFDLKKTRFLTPADACGIIIIDNGYPKSYSACFPPPVGCIKW